MQLSTCLSKLPVLVGSGNSSFIVAAKSFSILQRVERRYTMSTEDNKTLIYRKFEELNQENKENMKDVY
ncbi:MAG: hypothetical protein NVS4B11_00670 [Ktedonobacteraceae bacterium]